MCTPDDPPGFDYVAQFEPRPLRFGVIVSDVVDILNGDAGPQRDANEAQAEYYRLELSGIRARAESDLAHRYIELQQIKTSAERVAPPTCAE